MEKFKSEEDYQERCHQLYSILKHSCAVGQALPKVNTFKKKRMDILHGRNYVNTTIQKEMSHPMQRCLCKLVNLKLKPNSFGGAEKYISEYEDILLKLEEAGDPLSDNQKTTMFLDGIYDRNYDAYKTLCKSEDYNFDKCIRELRNESEAHYRLTAAYRPTQKANTQVT